LGEANIGSHELLAWVAGGGWAEYLLSQRVAVNIVILGMSAVVQSTAGFGAALFGLPLLLWADNSLVEAQLLILTAMLPQNVFASWRLRKSINFREVAIPALIRILAMPVGVAGLVLLMSLPKAVVGQFVGVVILAAIVAQYFTGFEWKNARRWPWMLITFGGSGILQGLTGTGGPPMVLWVYGQRYSVNRARAFLFGTYVACFVPQLCLLYWNFGRIVWMPMLTAILALPIVLLSSELGLKMGSRIGDRWMRPVTYWMLILLALAAIVEPWLDTVDR
jgi:hypothetical protein